MSNIIPFYKQVGETPFLAVSRFRDRHNILTIEKVAYAGRLDPLAEGVLLLIKGDDLKNFNNHLFYDKEYEATILFGFRTDTYDVMGLPTKGTVIDIKEPSLLLRDKEGDINMPLPPFSSYRIKGKPLFWWTREGRLSEVDVPIKNYTIEKIDVVSLDLVNSDDLLSTIKDKIGGVQGDFRQKKIIEEWERVLAKEKVQYTTLRINVIVSSGFYVRGFANLIGEESGAGGTLLHLKRTVVGRYSENDCV